MPNVFVSHHPLVQHKLSILRDVKTEPKKFRQLVKEITALIAYEATLDLATYPVDVQNSPGNCEMPGTARKDWPGTDLARRGWVWWKASGN